MKIKCTLPNASEEMNGIRFVAEADGVMVSAQDVAPDLAKIFLSVPGFAVAEDRVSTSQPAEASEAESTASSADAKRRGRKPAAE